ncbi:hypothetical protein ACFY8S_25270 [Streptomyces hygroscopicus]|uniref:hypothetical protein n=1 Tax=Streptomyces hygroscopicus TaxID=1912 RepID=UPI003695AACA
MILKGESDLVGDPFAEQPFELIFEGVFGASEQPARVEVRVSPEVLADLLAQGRGRQMSFLVRERRRAERAFATQLAIGAPALMRDSPEYRTLLNDLLTGLERVAHSSVD